MSIIFTDALAQSARDVARSAELLGVAARPNAPRPTLSELREAYRLVLEHQARIAGPVGHLPETGVSGAPRTTDWRIAFDDIPRG